jgi:hypothetical protein
VEMNHGGVFVVTRTATTPRGLPARRPRLVCVALPHKSSAGYRVLVLTEPGAVATGGNQARFPFAGFPTDLCQKSIA